MNYNKITVEQWTKTFTRLYKSMTVETLLKRLEALEAEGINNNRDEGRLSALKNILIING